MSEFVVTDASDPRFSDYARGDGVYDDTAPIQDRIRAAATLAGGCVRIPPGSYRITAPLSVPGGLVAIRGCGYMTNLQWTFDGSLFRWSGPCLHGLVGDLKITATRAIAAVHAAFDLRQGASDLTIERVRIAMDEPEKRVTTRLGTKVLQRRWGTGVRIAAPLKKPAGGSIRLLDLEFWHYAGTAIELRDVTDVWIRGGRFPAIGRRAGSVGIRLAGHTGGVLVTDCDVSEADVGLLVEREAIRLRPRRLASWNRELFLQAVLLDACNDGLVIRDRTFVTATGCWFASCNGHNLLVEDGSAPTLELTGGIVFNAGTLGPVPSVRFPRHGAAIFGGTLTMSGVAVKNNAGTGLIVGPKVEGYTVSGCQILENGHGADVQGRAGTLVGNLFRRNALAPQFTSTGGGLAWANALA